MRSRDPRIDSQPGDEVRVDDLIRNVIARDGETVFIHGPRTRLYATLAEVARKERRESRRGESKA
jgi:hypothetical protein